MKRPALIALQFLTVIAFVLWIYPYAKQAHMTAINDRRCHANTEEGYEDVDTNIQREFVSLLGVATSSSGYVLIVDPIDKCTEEERIHVTTSGCFYKNVVLEEKPLSLASDVEVFTQTWSHTSQGDYCWDEKVLLEDFATYGFSNVEEKMREAQTRLPECFPSDDPYYDSIQCVESYDLRSPLVDYDEYGLPFVIEVKDGVVIKIVERYIP